MAEDVPGPESLTIRGIPIARRGLDRRAVEQMLEDAERAWSALRDEHALLLTRIEQSGGIDYLATDLGAMAQEIGAILSAAEEAAHGIRMRAAHDSEERMRTAAATASRDLEEAHRQAFDLRRDAWEAGTGLLDSVMETTARMVQRAEADVLVIRAEAEQEAHRRVNAARKEGDDIIRNARYDADRMVNEARASADSLVGDARRDAEAAQERTRALEERRKKLMADIEEARVSQLDGGSFLDDTGVVEAVPAPEPEPPPVVTRLAGAGIRIIAQPSSRPQSPGDSLGFDDLDPRHPGYGDALAEEVGRLGGPERSGQSPDPGSSSEVAEEVPLSGVAEEVPQSGESESGVDVVPTESPDPEPAPAPRPGPSHAVEGEGNVGALFAKLRGSKDAATPEQAAKPATKQVVKASVEASVEAPAVVIDDEVEMVPIIAHVDAVELRDRFLQPVQNAGLRAAKDVVMSLQNEALDALRVDERWKPDSAAIPAALSGLMKLLSADAGEAGAVAAAEVTSGGVIEPAPSMRARDLIAAMGDDLVRNLGDVDTRLGDAGAKDRAAEFSRAFRSWRTDEAERWVRIVAIAAYHDALLEGFADAGIDGVTAVEQGRSCAECPVGRGRWTPGGKPPSGSILPPAHLDCACGISPE